MAAALIAMAALVTQHHTDNYYGLNRATIFARCTRMGKTHSSHTAQRTFFCAAASPQMFHAAMRTVPASGLGANAMSAAIVLFVGCASALALAFVLPVSFSFPLDFVTFGFPAELLVAFIPEVFCFFGAGSASELSAPDGNAADASSSSEMGSGALRFDTAVAAARFGGMLEVLAVNLVSRRSGGRALKERAQRSREHRGSTRSTRNQGTPVAKRTWMCSNRIPTKKVEGTRTVK